MQAPPSHVAVMVPVGHTVHVQAPGSINGVANAHPAMQNPAAATGMIHDPAAAGALAAMNAAIPTQAQVTSKNQGTVNETKRKNKGARPTENGGTDGKTAR